jgi:hypothetical protein
MYIKMNTVNCKSFREKLLEQSEEGEASWLSSEMYGHKDNCAECLWFYETIRTQYQHLEEEKKIEVNPYLINKIMLKTSIPKNNIFFKTSFAKSPLSFIGVILISVWVGVGINNFLYSGESMQDEPDSTAFAANQNETTDASNASGSAAKANEAVANSENDILTLND